jgi:hypothetical protein
MFGYAVLTLSPNYRYRLRLSSSHMDSFGAWSAFRTISPPAVLVRLKDAGGQTCTILSAKGINADRLFTAPEFTSAVRAAVRAHLDDDEDQ